MNRNPLNIESLLEQIGSADVPEDTVHRYELRRELLCSRYFGDHCARQQRWNRLLTFTVPLLTGGMLVVVFSFVGASLSETLPFSSQVESTDVVQAIESQKIVSEETDQFVDSRQPIPMYEVIKFIPAQTVDYILMH